MIAKMIELQMTAGVMVASVVLTLAFGLLAGQRVHFWLWAYLPVVGRMIPTDGGAWIGLTAAILAILL